jgi:hypothetical protein
LPFPISFSFGSLIFYLLLCWQSWRGRRGGIAWSSCASSYKHLQYAGSFRWTTCCIRILASHAAWLRSANSSAQPPSTKAEEILNRCWEYTGSCH